MHVSRLIRRALEKIRDEIATDEQLEAASAPKRRALSASLQSLGAYERRAARGLPLLHRGEGATSGCRRGRSIRAPTIHSTLLTSAGMQPQMPYFLGREQPPAPLTCTSQKCFRTPDIDEVGT
jgi:hypothetical protein